MPQNPTTPKLAIRASPSWRWSSSARPITITTSNSPEIRKASSQSRFMAYTFAVSVSRVPRTFRTTTKATISTSCAYRTWSNWSAMAASATLVRHARRR